eukprot:gnl/TRDRNA2_/TRDRNA2_92570_c0_seq1.p1 gnl/TRDRNA2_/TRDRNA2_92570_c0~~gnl/TRDRNA2_/TRDRNA2_92570_c0_seq1.p1  ORF type:complete len:187 (+),score=26.39 gnl/TRDRNA2_/TRDRNA2_92570_c0_seq1:74-562(+)
MRFNVSIPLSSNQTASEYVRQPRFRQGLEEAIADGLPNASPAFAQVKADNVHIIRIGMIETAPPQRMARIEMAPSQGMSDDEDVWLTTVRLEVDFAVAVPTSASWQPPNMLRASQRRENSLAHGPLASLGALLGARPLRGKDPWEEAERRRPRTELEGYGIV